MTQTNTTESIIIIHNGHAVAVSKSAVTALTGGNVVTDAEHAFLVGAIFDAAKELDATFGLHAMVNAINALQTNSEVK
jgi:hypothetical protein